MSAFSRAKCKKAITEVRKLIHTKCQTQDNALVKLWHSNNQMQEISGIVVQSGVFSMTDPFANSSYPFPTDRMIRGISYLVKPIKLPSQMFQHDITFTFPSDYGALLVEQQKDLSAEVLYGSRLLCYKKDDTQRRIVWPSCVLAVFISGYMKPVPIPRKVKRRIVNNAQADPSSARIIEVGGDFVANLTPFLRNGLNVLTIITNGTEEIDNYIIAVDFVALVTEARLRYDLGISKHTFSIDGSIKKRECLSLGDRL
ncbi:hypothetical protein HDU79_010345 [Rhizoclosmatium sp. JEL0117]|nr:hypothetical protein HDU79_010345 [Rhizoclosmatium sp. JEL0117]